ncbi:putative PKS/NRPS-like protein biosynthetic cluster [Aspergillus tubingensis]|uniref:PKS/NRPS-like protein biosynthetic cluster n=1 Tax=Aspergillus tubingensis TaxID=5068 RepID=A0A9W6AY85_ASPTU|nr:putative PKS/NRPS-like protein biosynthetic cluster [Aspergillus tubingensis]GLA88175.1 putative PKS/NRPS-like protein biosynthetic cluster [Aspergillus tubingensis]
MPEVLDFFFAAGSISGSFGAPGQANYAAANTFLNAFVQYRRSLGLPASVLHIGLMDDIGYLAKNTDKADALRAADGYFLREMDLLDSLNWAIVKSAVDPMEDGSLTIGLRCDKPLSDPSNRIMWRKDPRMGVFQNIYNEAPANSSGGNRETDALKSFLTSVEADPEKVLNDPASVEVVTHELAVKIYTFMLQPLEDLDAGVSPAALGVDSLVTIEIRNWIKRSLGDIEISTLEILNAGSIATLGMLVIEALKKKFVSQNV